MADPATWLARRLGDRLALSWARRLMAQATPHLEGARFTPWTRSREGGIGVITFQRGGAYQGSVQAFRRDGAFRVEWFGRSNHPYRHREDQPLTRAAFRDRLREYTQPAHVAMRGTEAGPHHMLI